MKKFIYIILAVALAACASEQPAKSLSEYAAEARAREDMKKAEEKAAASSAGLVASAAVELPCSALSEACSDVEEEAVWVEDDGLFLGVDPNLPVDGILEGLDDQTGIVVDYDSYYEGDGCSYCLVDIQGVPFGMNLDGEPDSGPFSSAVFITSEPSDEVFEMLVPFLSGYYGEPEIAEPEEFQYGWFSDEYYIKARRIRTKEGGWIVLFSKR